jgi:hypothetical protein
LVSSTSPLSVQPSAELARVEQVEVVLDLLGLGRGREDDRVAAVP